MSEENTKGSVGVKGVRPNFTPNESKGYRIRPIDALNWSVVQVKVKGAGSKDAGQEYESSPMSYTQDLFSSVSFIMRFVGATTGKRYQDEHFKLTGMASDMNALALSFKETSSLCVKAIEDLEDRILTAGIRLAPVKELPENEKLGVLGLRGELGDVRKNFLEESRKVLGSIEAVGKRAMEFGLDVSPNLDEEKMGELRKMVTSDNFEDLVRAYREAYDEAMNAVKSLYARLEDVGISKKNLGKYLIQAEGGTLEVEGSAADEDAEVETEVDSASKED